MNNKSTVTVSVQISDGKNETRNSELELRRENIQGTHEKMTQTWGACWVTFKWDNGRSFIYGTPALMNADERKVSSGEMTFEEYEAKWFFKEVVAPLSPTEKIIVLLGKMILGVKVLEQSKLYEQAEYVATKVGRNSPHAHENDYWLLTDKTGKLILDGARMILDRWITRRNLKDGVVYFKPEAV